MSAKITDPVKDACYGTFVFIQHPRRQPMVYTATICWMMAASMCAVMMKSGLFCADISK